MAIWTLLAGPLIKFDLVLTGKHWELNQDGGVGKEVTGPPEWRIDCSERALWVDVDAAIHYVTQLRDKTIDPAIKKNADQTLAKLLKLR